MREGEEERGGRDSGVEEGFDFLLKRRFILPVEARGGGEWGECARNEKERGEQGGVVGRGGEE